MKPLFRVKICGITNPADALAAAAAGADAIGLNFYSKSPRYITAEQAAEVVAVLPPHVARVGVFVNETPERILELAKSLSLDWIQLHGDEPAAMLATLAPYRVIRAFRCSSENQEEAFRWLVEAAHKALMPAAILLDAFHASQFGGTGKKLDCAIVAQFRERWSTMPIILAGGLTLNNVFESIQSSRPNAVDTASGVETSPGKKDADLVRGFVANARDGLNL